MNQRRRNQLPTGGLQDPPAIEEQGISGSSEIPQIDA
jgi:hypothetical protein